MKLGPYELNTIVTGDARELLPRLPDQCAALSFADPPYWVGFDYGEKTDKEMAYIEPSWLVKELSRISMVVMITPGIGHSDSYPKPYWKIAWVKLNSEGRNISGGANAWEPIHVYGKTRIDTDAVNIPMVSQPDASFHKCPKPLKLMLHLVEKYTRPGDVVIDPLSGSGTTAKACKILGRAWWGCEIDPAITALANARVANTQPPLFVPQHEQLELT